MAIRLEFLPHLFKIWVTVSALFSIALLQAANASQVPLTPGSYEVTVNTSLVLREAPSSQALQVGSIMNGDLVEVLSCTDNWAEVTYNGKKGYVSARYLKAYIPSDECAVPDIDDDKLFGYQTYIFLYEKMPYVILGLSILLLLLARTPLCSTLLVLMGVAELLFVAGIMAPGHGEMVWFGDPNEVGWLYAALGFVLLIAILGMQFAVFRPIMSELFPGCLGTLLGYPLILVAGLSVASLLLSFKLWFIVLGIIGVLWIAMVVRTSRGLLGALRSVLLVILVCGGFLAMVWETAGVLIGGFLILLLVGAVANGESHASVQDTSQTPLPPTSGTSQETARGDRVIYDSNGHPTFLTRNPITGDWQDESGHPWDVDGNGCARRR